jgi:hypothetical protein
MGYFIKFSGYVLLLHVKQFFRFWRKRKTPFAAAFLQPRRDCAFFHNTLSNDKFIPNKNADNARYSEYACNQRVYDGDLDARAEQIDNEQQNRSANAVRDKFQQKLHRPFQKLEQKAYSQKTDGKRNDDA